MVQAAARSTTPTSSWFQCVRPSAAKNPVQLRAVLQTIRFSRANQVEVVIAICLPSFQQHPNFLGAQQQTCVTECSTGRNNCEHREEKDQNKHGDCVLLDRGIPRQVAVLLVAAQQTLPVVVSVCGNCFDSCCQNRTSVAGVFQQIERSQFPRVELGLWSSSVGIGSVPWIIDRIRNGSASERSMAKPRMWSWCNQTTQNKRVDGGGVSCFAKGKALNRGL